MKKMSIPVVLAAIGIFCFSAFAGGLGKSAVTAEAGAKGPGPGPKPADSFKILDASAEEKMAVEGSFDPEKANVPADALVLMTLEGGRGEDHGTFRIYTRCKDTDDRTGCWQQVLVTTAMCGRNGLYKEIEGDKKTPVGIFKMNTPFGILPSQEGFPPNYVQVDDRFYWVGDSASPMYNRFVRNDIYSDFDKSSSEHLSHYGGYYDYCIDIGYNPDGTPHKGSAIFLHCVVEGNNTSGCVAIPAADMITALKTYQEGLSYMVIYDREDIGAVYKPV